MRVGSTGAGILAGCVGEALEMGEEEDILWEYLRVKVEIWAVYMGNYGGMALSWNIRGGEPRDGVKKRVENGVSDNR